MRLYYEEGKNPTNALHKAFTGAIFLEKVPLSTLVNEESSACVKCFPAH